jgi:hypothetical protein
VVPASDLGKRGARPTAADHAERAPSNRGIERNELWWSLRAATVNLRRLLVLGLSRQNGAWVLA